VTRWWRSRFGGSLVRELVVVVALLLVYKYGRFLVKDHVATALRHAHEVIGFERSLGVFSEARFQDLVASSAAVARFLNVYYLVAHVAVTAAVFVWLYVRHPESYRRFRNVMIVITVAGLIGHMAFPLAPPRMFPRLGFIDTARVFGPASYGSGSPYKGFADRFAAMPSLHFGWALVVAWAAIIASPSRWRYTVIAHPVITLAAIVLTANHYWLDAVVATFLFALALAFDHSWERRRARHLSATVAVAARARSPRSPRARSWRASPSTWRPRAPREPVTSSARCAPPSSTEADETPQSGGRANC
jgi:PAP2 superfamily